MSESGTGDLALRLVRTLSPVDSKAPASSFDVLALAGNGQASVQWRSLNALATSYTVIASPGGASVTVAGGSVRGAAVVPGLTNGTAYSFTVSANNTAGSSLASAPSNAVTPSTLPSSILPVTDGLEFWWSSAQMGSPADGSAVAQLTDYSGNGYHAAAEAAGATFKAAWSNGKPSVSFPGTGARFNTIGSGLISGMRGPRQTIYLLYSAAAAPNAGGVAGDRVLSVETPYTALSTNGFSYGFAIATGYAAAGKVASVVDRTSGTLGSGVEAAAASTSLNAPTVITAARPGTADVNGTDLGVTLGPAVDLRPLMRKDRTLGTTNAAVDPTGYSIGSALGGRFNQHFQGDLAEVLIFVGAHTAAQRAAMRAYLATRS